MRFFCVRELVHASLVQKLLHASVALALSPKNGDQIQASHWQSKVDSKSGGQKWTLKVVAKSGPQKWRNLSKIESVLLSASVERLDVSRMRDFLQ